jgi:hypothetical protein
MQHQMVDGKEIGKEQVITVFSCILSHILRMLVSYVAL